MDIGEVIWGWGIFLIPQIIVLTIWIFYTGVRTMWSFKLSRLQYITLIIILAISIYSSLYQIYSALNTIDQDLIAADGSIRTIQYGNIEYFNYLFAQGILLLFEFILIIITGIKSIESK